VFENKSFYFEIEGFHLSEGSSRVEHTHTQTLGPNTKKQEAARWNFHFLVKHSPYMLMTSCNARLALCSIYTTVIDSRGILLDGLWKK